MKTQNEVLAALKALKFQHKNNWLAWYARMEAVLAVMSSRMNCRWMTTEDITEHVTNEDFAAAGFSESETEAMIFVLTEDCMGQAVSSV